MSLQGRNGKTRLAEYAYMEAGFPRGILARTTDAPGKQTMSNWLEYLAPIAVAVVGLVLLAGLVNMMRGGSSSRSQTLMRWRVILQFVAIVIIMAALYFGSR